MNPATRHNLTPSRACTTAAVTEALRRARDWRSATDLARQVSLPAQEVLTILEGLAAAGCASRSVLWRGPRVSTEWRWRVPADEDVEPLPITSEGRR